MGSSKKIETNSETNSEGALNSQYERIIAILQKPIDFNKLIDKVQRNVISTIDLRECWTTLTTEQFETLEFALRTNKSVVQIIYPVDVVQALNLNKENKAEETEKGKEKEEPNSISNNKTLLSILDLVSQNAKEFNIKKLIARIKYDDLNELDLTNHGNLEHEQLLELAYYIGSAKNIKKITLPNSRNNDETWKLISLYARIHHKRDEIRKIEIENANNEKEYTQKRIKTAFKEPLQLYFAFSKAIVGFTSTVFGEALSYLTLVKPIYTGLNFLFSAKKNAKFHDIVFDTNDGSIKYKKTSYLVNNATRYIAPLLHGIKAIGKVIGAIIGAALAAYMSIFFIFLTYPLMIGLTYLKEGKFYPQLTPDVQLDLDRLNEADINAIVRDCHHNYMQKQLEYAQNAIDDQNPELAYEHLEEYKRLATEEKIDVDIIKEKNDYFNFHIYYLRANRCFFDENYQEALNNFELARQYEPENNITATSLNEMIRMVQTILAGKRVILGENDPDGQYAITCHLLG